MTQQTFDPYKARDDLYVQFWYNTVFDQDADGNVVIDYAAFNILAEMCIYIQRGQ